MLRIAAGTYDQVLVILAALADHYGWNGQMGRILSDLVLDKGKADRLLAEALSAFQGSQDTEASQEIKAYH